MSEVTNGPSSGGNASNRRGWRLPDETAAGGAPGYPRPDPDQRPRGMAAPPPRELAAQPTTLPASVAGLARAVNPTTVQNPNGTSTTVVTLRLEQYDARAGRTAVMTVRLFGENALGFVTEGDWVEVTGKVKNGFIKADKAVNHTSHARYSRSGGGAVKVVQIIIFCLILSFILGIGVSILLSVLHNR